MPSPGPSAPAVDSATRVVLRPVANPFALGFLGLAGATLVLAGQELGWIPPGQGVEVAAIVLISAPGLQLLASVFGFLGRDPVAATGMGLLAATWTVTGVVHLLAPPGRSSAALGTFLFLAAVSMGVSALTAAHTKLLPAAVMATTGARFFLTGLSEVTGSAGVRTAAGVVGCLLCALAVYAAAALELEGFEHRTVLPTGRRGRGRVALVPDLAEQVRSVAAEPGVRNQL